MRKLKKLFAAVTLTTVLTFGATFANAGLLISDFSGGDSKPCADTTSSGVTGVLITGFTGVLITGATDVPTNCESI